MRARFDRLAAGAFKAVPIVALILVLAGLIAVDRAFVSSDEVQLEAARVQATVQIGHFLDEQRGALVALHALFTSADTARAGARLPLLLNVLGDHIGALQRIWVANADAIVVRDTTLAGPTNLSLLGADLDTVSRFRLATLAAAARGTQGTQTSQPARLDASESGFVMLDPVFRGGAFAGVVAGAISSDTLESYLATHAALDRIDLVILADGDTVVKHMLPRRAILSGESEAEFDIATPGTEKWHIAIRRANSRWMVRTLLWTLGLFAVAVVLAIAARDARQADHMAERSRELERLSGELLQANRTKSEFLANVSHELRTPLTAIVGFVELLRDGVYGELNARQAGPVDRIAASATHLRHLVDQVLDLAKITAGRVEVHDDPIDLRALVLDTASEVESLIAERELHLAIAVGTTLPRLRSDPGHLRQILLNLLSNAIKCTRTGTITIRARLKRLDLAGRMTTPVGVADEPPAGAGDWIALQVVDPGIGIAERDLDRIFEEFEQVDAGPRGNSMQRGTGLGLSISRRLARVLGGDITVQSELGKGSTFTLWLPVTRSDRGRAAVGAGASPTAESGSAIS